LARIQLKISPLAFAQKSEVLRRFWKKGNCSRDNKQEIRIELSAIISYICLVLFFSSAWNPLWGQDPYGRVLNQKSGLPSNTVYDLFQDKQGFIWIATSKGICRYDGLIFRNYPTIGNFSLEGSNIQQDKLGRIWYQNFDGLLLYLENDTLRKFKDIDPAGFIPFELADSILFAFDKKGILYINLNNLSIIRKEKMKIGEIFGTAGNNQCILIISDTVLLAENSGKIKKMRIPFQAKLKGSISSRMHQNKILLGNRYNPAGELFCYSMDGNFHACTIPQNSIIQNISIFGQDAWLSTPKGTIQLHNWDTKEYTSRNYFINKNISDVLYDREGNYWFSTIGEGLILVHSLTNTYYPLGIKPSSIQKAGNLIFISSMENQIISFDSKTEQVSPIFTGENKVPPSMFTYIPEKKVIGMASDSFRIFNLNGTRQSTLDLAVKDLIFWKNEYAFAASVLAGIIRVKAGIPKKWSSLETRRIFAKDFYRIEEIMSGGNFRNILWEEKLHSFILGGGKGLFRIEQNSEKELKKEGESVLIKKLVQLYDINYGLTNNNVFVEIHGNNIIESDLNTLLPKGEILQFDSNDGRLIIRYMDMILVYNPLTRKTLKLPIYDKSDELIDCWIEDNQIIRVLNQGLVIEALDTSNAPSLPLFVINYLSTNIRVLPPDGDLRLNTKENNLTINFSVLSFRNQFRPNLWYQLNDQEWKEIPSGMGNLFLASLSPGSYSVQFRFENSPKICGTVVFTIYKPIWNENWFILLVIFILISVLLIYYKWQIGIIQGHNKLLTDKLQLEQDLKHSKLTAIRAQMNPHFFFNALNTIQSFIVSDDKKNASTYLNKFARLTRTVLEMSEKENVLLKEEIQALALYLEIEKARFSNDFAYSIIVDPEINLDTCRIPSLYLQPFVENSLKHGLLHKAGNKRLLIEFSSLPSGILILIDDNGIGRKISGELNAQKLMNHNSFASQAQLNRTNILNQGRRNKITLEIKDKVDENNRPIGTSVIIYIPKES